MTTEYIEYRSGYKYQLATNFEFQTDIIPNEVIKDQFIELGLDGVLNIKSGYAWDGVSGPVIDTERNMRASLIHDALYQLMREKKLSGAYKERADEIFRNICIKDGVEPIIARSYFEVLKLVGTPYADPINAKKTLQAPNYFNLG